jgi:hypothetical protein
MPITRYEEAQLIIEDAHTGHDYAVDILEAHQLAATLRKKRFSAGSVDFATPEAKVILNEEDEPVDLALVLGRHHCIRIEAGFGIFFKGGHHAANLRRQVSRHILGKSPDARATGQEARPGRFHICSKGRDRSHARNNNPSHQHLYQFGSPPNFAGPSSSDCRTYSRVNW